MIQKGDTVEFLGGAVQETVTWSGTDYPSHLIVGRQYRVKTVEIHTAFTRITLDNYQGTFNSVHFRIV